MPSILRLRTRAITLVAAFALAAGTSLAFGVAVSAAPSHPKVHPSITKASFGSVGGQNVDISTLTNSNRMEVKILTYGGIIQSVKVPDKAHRYTNVTLGSRPWTTT